MGVLNVTPDSFSDGGSFVEPAAAADRAFGMLEEGADIVDVGGESTRPGASPVTAEEEWSRVGPVLERLIDFPVPISIDTTKSEIAHRAVDHGAAIINDVSGLRFDAQLGSLAAERRAGLVLMHMRGTPRTMQDDVEYSDLIADVRAGLASSLELALEAGCETHQIVLDPGLGFGKSAEGTLALLNRLPELGSLGRPILVGPSRKAFIGRLLDASPEYRVEGTIAACVVALIRGARIFRVHDVAAVRKALTVADAIRSADGRRKD
jgi:dihydropteroate synthase